MQTASNSVSTPVIVIQEKTYQKRPVLAARSESSIKARSKKRTATYRRGISHASDHSTDAMEMNNFSVYENSDRIVLPKRRQRLKHPLRCFYCGEWFNCNENTSGSCREAPDPVERTIRFLTCYPVAEGAVYHCCRSDDDIPANISRFGQGYNVFSFGPRHISLHKRVKRWLLLLLMSLIVPCLCCYFPAHLINKCFGGGKRGRHQSYHSTATFES
ncbi:unnamed protein product [Litomosoides sigmodontis]|uniref:Uncharacterized protein n=1 Tax=Litomosoides sigmodontis TaxID=42156 RepID=A0A3P6SHI0_LITSI|nr:unnamed protein product [Litomosoides sigmodontis]